MDNLSLFVFSSTSMADVLTCEMEATLGTLNAGFEVFVMQINANKLIKK
jgi:hypothetical protein